MRDADWVAFLQWALPQLRMRWPGFRKVRGQVRKRVSRRLQHLGLSGLGDYRTYLDTNPDEWEVLDSLCRITISRFLRDRGVWEIVRTRVLPELAQKARNEGRDTLRIWSAGCASGEEPYTFFLVWRLAHLGRDPLSTATEESPASGDRASDQAIEGPPWLELSILATDADTQLLDRARAGVYPKGSLKELPGAWTSAAFTEIGDDFRLRPEFKTGIEFLCHDIRQPPPDGPFDLISCRNQAFTYFDEGLQKEVLSALLFQLTPEGVLLIGGHETLPAGSWGLSQIRPGQPLYRHEGSG